MIQIYLIKRQAPLFIG